MIQGSLFYTREQRRAPWFDTSTSFNPSRTSSASAPQSRRALARPAVRRVAPPCSEKVVGKHRARLARFPRGMRDEPVRSASFPAPVSGAGDQHWPAPGRRAASVPGCRRGGCRWPRPRRRSGVECFAWQWTLEQGVGRHQRRHARGRRAAHATQRDALVQLHFEAMAQTQRAAQRQQGRTGGVAARFQRAVVDAAMDGSNAHGGLVRCDARRHGRRRPAQWPRMSKPTATLPTLA